MQREYLSRCASLQLPAQVVEPGAEDCLPWPTLATPGPVGWPEQAAASRPNPTNTATSQVPGRRPPTGRGPDLGPALRLVNVQFPPDCHAPVGMVVHPGGLQGSNGACLPGKRVAALILPAERTS